MAIPLFTPDYLSSPTMFGAISTKTAQLFLEQGERLGKQIEEQSAKAEAAAKAPAIATAYADGLSRIAEGDFSGFTMLGRATAESVGNPFLMKMTGDAMSEATRIANNWKDNQTAGERLNVSLAGQQAASERQVRSQESIADRQAKSQQAILYRQEVNDYNNTEEKMRQEDVKAKNAFIEAENQRRVIAKERGEEFVPGKEPEPHKPLPRPTPPREEADLPVDGGAEETGESLMPDEPLPILGARPKGGVRADLEPGVQEAQATLVNEKQQIASRAANITSPVGPGAQELPTTPPVQGPAAQPKEKAIEPKVKVDVNGVTFKIYADANKPSEKVSVTRDGITTTFNHDKENEVTTAAKELPKSIEFLKSNDPQLTKILTDGIKGGKKVGVTLTVKDKDGNPLRPSGYNPKEEEDKQPNWFVIVDGKPQFETKDVTEGNKTTKVAVPIEVSNKSAMAVRRAEAAINTLHRNKAIAIDTLSESKLKPTKEEAGPLKQKYIEALAKSKDPEKEFEFARQQLEDKGIKLDKSEVPGLVKKDPNAPDKQLLKGRAELEKLGIKFPEKEFKGMWAKVKDAFGDITSSVGGAIKEHFTESKSDIQNRITKTEDYLKAHGNELPPHMVVVMGAKLAEDKEVLKKAK